MGLLQDTKITNNLTTIPESIRNYLDLEDGDRVEWHIQDGDIVVREKQQSENE